MKSFAELLKLPKAAVYLNAWAEAFADVLEKISSAKHPAELVAVESIEPEALLGAEKGLCLIFSASEALAGEQAFYVSEADAIILAQLLVGEGSDAAAPLRDEDRDAAAEVFRQVAGQTAIDLTSKWGATASLSFDAARAPGWEPSAKAAIRVTASDARKLVVILALQQNLLAVIEETAAAAKPSADSKGSPELDPPLAKDATPSNLDLLLDIELDVTIRFGQREMLLRDVLDLRLGSVIELERRVEEPAELLVAGRPVARGEVVVVEGNYGLRITEILSPRQRLDVVGK